MYTFQNYDKKGFSKSTWLSSNSTICPNARSILVKIFHGLLPDLTLQRM